MSERLVLVADDQAVHREMIARAVASCHVQPPPGIVLAENGQEALERLREGVDAAFLDLRMPGMSGLDVLIAWRSTATGAETPIFIVSSSSDPRDVAAAERAGVTGYIEKGRFPELQARIGGTLDRLWPQGPAHGETDRRPR